MAICVPPRLRVLLFAAALIPMNLSEWTRVPIPSRSFPEATNRDEKQIFRTKSAAGGFAHLLVSPLTETTGGTPRVSWKWAVKQDSASHPRLPFPRLNCQPWKRHRPTHEP